MKKGKQKKKKKKEQKENEEEEVRKEGNEKYKGEVRDIERERNRGNSADDVEDSIDSTNVGKESIAETKTLRSTLDEAGDVEDLKERRNLACRLVLVAQHVEPLVWNRNAAKNKHNLIF